MGTRRLSRFDRLLVGVSNALRTVAAPAGQSPRPNPAADLADDALDSAEKSHAAGLMRVNHAGEVAAQALYQGHAVVARSDATEAEMRKAAKEEFDHLAWCEQRLSELGERPSRLSPIWYAGAFAIGAASGALGDKWSLGFIAETEQQVVDHLTTHLEGLPENDLRSRAIVSRMRDEEEEHGAHARAAGAAELPASLRRLMRTTARIMTTTAYRI